MSELSPEQKDEIVSAFVRRIVSSSTSDDHLRAIGQITVNFSALEFALSFLVWAFLGIGQEKGEIITSRLSFRVLLQLASSLYRHRVSDPEGIAQFDELLARISEAGDRRNQMIHSLWMGNLDGRTLRYKATIRQREGLKRQIQGMAVKDLDEIATLIAQVTREIGPFLEHYWLDKEKKSENGQ